MCSVLTLETWKFSNFPNLKVIFRQMMRSVPNVKKGRHTHTNWLFDWLRLISINKFATLFYCKKKYTALKFVCNYFETNYITTVYMNCSYVKYGMCTFWQFSFIHHQHHHQHFNSLTSISNFLTSFPHPIFFFFLVNILYFSYLFLVLSTLILDIMHVFSIKLNIKKYN